MLWQVSHSLLVSIPKDMILEAAFAAHTGVGQMAFWLGCLAALLTAFYSWRLLIMAFHGTPRASAEVMSHVHESPNVMLLPLVPLALGAIFAGFLGYEMFVGYDWQQFWGDLNLYPANTSGDGTCASCANLGKAVAYLLGGIWCCARLFGL